MTQTNSREMQIVMAIYFDGKNIKNKCEHIELGTAEKEWHQKRYGQPETQLA
jgi:hypothetical protein